MNLRGVVGVVPMYLNSEDCLSSDISNGIESMPTNIVESAIIPG